MEINIEILLTAVVVSSACALLGVFLVLKSMAMISDAITHTILLGIVIAFFIVHNLNSPFLIIGASITGVITVYLIDTLNSTKLVKEDSAIGIIFPFLFSIAVILISRFAGNIHLDIDSVDLGVPMLAMHSARELCGIHDTFYLKELAKEFFNKN